MRKGKKKLRKSRQLNKGAGALFEPYAEKSIASLLSAADERIEAMHRFNEKLALKT